MRYHPHTPSDIEAMLQRIGRPDVDDLFRSIPSEVALHRPLAVPAALDEASLLAELEGLAEKNRIGAQFIGAGAYLHHVPAIVDQLLLRSEWYTAYTPYQPELSQGTVQMIFEYQTYVCMLTGLDVANASMYDGATGAAEAALMAVRQGRSRRRILVGRNVNPEYRRVMATYLANSDVKLEDIQYGADGRLDLSALSAALGPDVAGVVVGYPNYFGVVEDLAAIAALVHGAGALLISATQEAVALGLLQPPGALGADIAVGELQSFGNPPQFGGPGLGFFATKEAYLRQMPGRLAGATVDADGKRGFVLTLSTREQHIRREKATSNICTNHGLCALAASIHLSVLGKTGLHELALLNYRRARALREKLAAAGIPVVFSGPTFNEFVVRVPQAASAFDRALAAGYVAGARLWESDPALQDCLLLCATEVHSPAQIDTLVSLLAETASSR